MTKQYIPKWICEMKQTDGWKTLILLLILQSLLVYGVDH